jgi:hypothetical protein
MDGHLPPPRPIRPGICKLCERLDLDPLEDVRVLVLLWKMGANKKPQEIQKEEWMAGCRKLQLDSIDTFIRFLPQLDTGFMDNEEFGDFYKVNNVASSSLDILYIERRSSWITCCPFYRPHISMPN